MVIYQGKCSKRDQEDLRHPRNTKSPTSWCGAVRLMGSVISFGPWRQGAGKRWLPRYLRLVVTASGDSVITAFNSCLWEIVTCG